MKLQVCLSNFKTYLNLLLVHPATFSADGFLLPLNELLASAQRAQRHTSRKAEPCRRGSAIFRVGGAVTTPRQLTPETYDAALQEIARLQRQLRQIETEHRGAHETIQQLESQQLTVRSSLQYDRASTWHVRAVNSVTMFWPSFSARRNRPDCAKLQRASKKVRRARRGHSDDGIARARLASRSQFL